MPLSVDRPLVIALVLAALVLAPHALLDSGASLDLAALTLVVAAVAYFGFVVTREIERKRAVELVIIGLCALAALGGVLLAPTLIPVAFLAHGLWDMWHRSTSRSIVIPRWGVTFTALVDWIIAAGLNGLWLFSGEMDF